MNNKTLGIDLWRKISRLLGVDERGGAILILRTTRWKLCEVMAGVLIGLAVFSEPAGAGVEFKDISPDLSPLYVSGTKNGASGGRINNLASVPGTNQVFYAASEWGGLWKTIDGGMTWFHLDGHVPPVTWDVAVDPGDPNTVYASSLFDGRVHSVSGILVSHDAGATWTHPLTVLPLGLNCVDKNGNPQPVPEQWSAFGIGIRPDDSKDVYVGTTCGVAVSHDSGVTWAFVDPNPTIAGLTYVWDVVVQGGGPNGKGIVDVCGAQGHSRSEDGGQTWESHELPYRLYYTGRCSIAVSPDEPYVVFLVDDITDRIDDPQPSYDFIHEIWESDNQGRNWKRLGKPYQHDERTKRLTFVVTNKRSSSGGNQKFDLWYGEGGLWWAHCTTPNPIVKPVLTTDQTLRCPKAHDDPDNVSGNIQWSGGNVEDRGAHGDSGDLEFNRTQSVDACPILYASDGGVFINKPAPGADCQSPTFQQPDRSPHALWLLGMAGSNLPNDVVALQFGATDNGSWAAPDAQGTSIWVDGPTSDSWSRVADATRYLWNDQDGLHLAPPGTLAATNIALPTETKSDGTKISRKIPEGGFIPKIAQFGDKKYVIVTDFIDLGDKQLNDADGGAKVFFTDDITANPAWTELPMGLPAGPFCGVQASVDPAKLDEPVFYLLQGSDCNDYLDGLPNILYKHEGTDPTTSWQQVKVNGSAGSSCDRIGTFAVDPKNAQRLYISNLCDTGYDGMRFSTDGGATWQLDQVLTDRMTGVGLLAPGVKELDFINRGGPDGVYGYRAFPFIGNAQPSLVAFDPDDPHILVAGGKDSGLFLSMDGGSTWDLLTDPIHPSSSRPHLSQPWFAHFKHDATNTLWLYIGTRGRGVWRISIRLPVADAGGPYTTLEGVNVSLAGSGSDPDGKPVIFAWDLNNDGIFETAGQNAVFDQVGQDGVYTVRLKVTADGVSSVATTTVTVSNVAPVVTLSSDAPVNENSAVTVSGVVSDPGWLDPLTATVDWEDATPVQPIAGVVENVRPDATLTFSVSHTYGDNGTFNAKICGQDDDTMTCQTIALSVTNVNPTATIDQSGTVPVNGVPTIIVHTGQSVPFAGRSQDPGSDDLTLTWEWDDGTPIVITTSLVNPPNPDPLPSPSIQPRDVTDTQSHAFGQACLYQVRFTSQDDDAGTGQDEVEVVVVGNAREVRSAGYWQTQFSKALGKPGKADLTPASLSCYLQIAGYMSTVFQEVRDASTVALAVDVLFQKQNGGSAVEHLDRQLLTAWLNFANGAIALTQLVDTNGDRVPDTPFVTVMSNAETVRLNPAATEDQLENQKDILEGINK
jgi:PKD domain